MPEQARRTQKTCSQQRDFHLQEISMLGWEKTMISRKVLGGWIKEAYRHHNKPFCSKSYCLAHSVGSSLSAFFSYSAVSPPRPSLSSSSWMFLCFLFLQVPPFLFSSLALLCFRFLHLAFFPTSFALRLPLNGTRIKRGSLGFVMSGERELFLTILPNHVAIFKAETGLLLGSGRREMGYVAGRYLVYILS